MDVLKQYDAIFDLFKNNTKSQSLSSKTIKHVDDISSSNVYSENNKYKNNFVKQNNNFISPYKNFLKNYLWKNKEYSFVLFPFSVKFRKSTIIIKICVIN